MSVSHSTRLLGLETRATLSLCETIGSVRALTVALLIKYKEFKQLVDLECNPDHYDTAPEFEADYQVTEMLKKNPRLPLGIDRRGVAIGKFFDAEELCRTTNARLYEFHEDPQSAGDEMVRQIAKIQQIIQSILGPSPTANDLRIWERNMHFGPGATTSVSGIVTKGRKFNNTSMDGTKDMVSFRAFGFPEYWKPYVSNVRLVTASKLTTVPKNAKTDRVICVEPDLNIFVQLGLGTLLKRKLLAVGLDLCTQDNNRRLASMAYRDNLATVDLSAASDTISESVVRLLLPVNWVELLEFCRVTQTRLPNGEVMTLQKWSSMGNGYTFELESLIFYACALACTAKDDWDLVSTFGDDIIIPASGLPLLERTLTFLGFKVNREKTHGIGSFHESCGHDFFKGVNVRPFYLRSDYHDFDSVCYIYANNARRWANRRNGGYSCDRRVLPFWLRCFTAAHPRRRYQIPEGFGDVGFVVDFDDAAPAPYRRKQGWGGWIFSYRRIRPVDRVISLQGCLTAYLCDGESTNFSQGREDLRDWFAKPQQKIGYVLQWPNLGPWI